MPKKLVVMLSLLCTCFIGLGAEPDIEQIRKKAEAGNAGAQTNLGLMYAKGKGVPQDYKEADHGDASTTPGRVLRSSGD